ncbi:MAG: hypothetical protein COT32_01040 [Candidatus Nealsonbacteria bacterium CG08_land_8_20_14_0_20_36_22]|uniref:SHS2 domain-containing protein n=1 Tax=Candidatus Nealsonbacteria bacterium CG08_land_8_20_14_0_20_36_22 TaxID=1974704 RepID=A0A2H0YPL1_9BACT|nr:MAG: hypothetical protein COT32_01040 [Candidatus Nealsonbacteria bacterium CG08_land_8_20_14_0_20_36_22]
MGFSFFYKKKERPFLVLDVGTEAVKVLACRKENSKTVILGAATQYFERYGVFNGQDFAAEIIKKAILKAIAGAEQDFIIYSERAKMPALVTLPPDVLRAEIIEQTFRQKDSKKKIARKEEKIILEQVFKGAQEEISQTFFKKFGILPKDINWISFNILNIKVDGYSVRWVQGYNGRELKFKILVIFSPKYYFESAQKILESLKLRVSKIIHLTEVLPVVFGEKISDGIFIDVGGRISQIFLIKNEELMQFRELEKGGEIFTQKLSETLGIDIESARIFKEKYASKQLSPESEQRIREIFLKEKRTWYESLDIFSSPIFLFGGASLLPEIRETPGESKVFYPKDLSNIEDATNKINVPQYTPSLLIAQFYGKEILRHNSSSR